MGRDCKVVTSFAKTCAAFAIDAKNTCGPSGWAKAASLAQAQNVSSQQCHRFGGKTCVIRAWVCDSRGLGDRRALGPGKQSGELEAFSLT